MGGAVGSLSFLPYLASNNNHECIGSLSAMALAVDFNNSDAPLFSQVVAAPSIPASAPIRRPAARKMTKLELQAVERTLLEERAKLRKEIEDARRTADELRAHNHKLKQLRAELPKIAVPSSPPRRKAFVSLPDLNVPVPDCYSPS